MIHTTSSVDTTNGVGTLTHHVSGDMTIVYGATHKQFVRYNINKCPTTTWTGEPNTVFDENMVRMARNRQKGVPQLALLASALDPRTKRMLFLPEQDSAKVWTAVQVYLEEMFAPPLPESEAESEAATVPAAIPSAPSVAAVTQIYFPGLDDDDATLHRRWLPLLLWCQLRRLFEMRSFVIS